MCWTVWLETLERYENLMSFIVKNVERSYCIGRYLIMKNAIKSYRTLWIVLNAMQWFAKLWECEQSENVGRSNVKIMIVLDVEVELIYNFCLFDTSTSTSPNLEAEQAKCKVYIREAYSLIVLHLDTAIPLTHQPCHGLCHHPHTQQCGCNRILV